MDFEKIEHEEFRSRPILFLFIVFFYSNGYFTLAPVFEGGDPIHTLKAKLSPSINSWPNELSQKEKHDLLTSGRRGTIVRVMRYLK